MLRSRLLLSVKKDAPHDATTVSHQLLTRGCFFKPGSASGLWETLPLGKRVLDKLERVVTEELETLPGCQKVEMTCLTSSEPWKKSTRWTNIGEEMFRLQDRKSNDMVLSPTHEEAFAQLVSSFYGVTPRSVLPLLLFQVGRKFRDELRPRAGLLRAREFVMKDLYSFDESEERALQTYNNVCRVYEEIFTKRLGCNIIKAKASSGSMGGNYSHEFHFESPVGEDTVYKCDSCDYAVNSEVAEHHEHNVKRACGNPACKGELRLTNCIEVGHSFFLGTTYSEVFKARFVPEGETKPKILQMCSYGLGITRIIAAIVETKHDQHGMIWPKEISPYQLALISAPEADREFTKQLFQDLKAKFKTDFLFDDRGENISFSAKIFDAKFIGIPFLCVTTKGNNIEVHRRSDGSITRFSDRSELLSFLCA